MFSCRTPRCAAAISGTAVVLLAVCIAGLPPAAARPAVVDCLEAFGPQCKQCTASRCTAVKQPKQFTIKSGDVVPEAGYQPGASPDTAEPCPAGTHKPRPAAEPCQLCSGGQKYQPGTGKSECRQCPAGRVVNDARTTCTKVVAGPGQQPGPLGPEPCPAGTAKAAAGDSKCARCNGGQSYQRSRGRRPATRALPAASPATHCGSRIEPPAHDDSPAADLRRLQHTYSAVEGTLRGETWALADLLRGADAETGVTRTDLASLALSCSGPCGTFGQRGDTETGAGGTVATLRSWIAGAETCTTLRWCDAYVPGGAGSYTASTGTCSQAGAFGIARSEPGNCYLQGRKTVLCAECPANCRACDPESRTCTRCADGFTLSDGTCAEQAALPPPEAMAAPAPPPPEFPTSCSNVADGTVCSNGNNAYLVNKFVLASDAYATCAAEGALRNKVWGQADLLAGADAETGVTRADLASLALSCSGACGTIGQRGDAELSGPQNGAVTLRTWLGGSDPCTTLRWCSAYVPGGAGAITPSEGFCTQGVNAGVFGLAHTEPGGCYSQARKTVLCAECPADCKACDPATRTCTRCLDGFELADGTCSKQAALPPPEAVTVPPPPEFPTTCSTVADGTVCSNGNNAFLVNKFVLASEAYSTCAAEGALRSKVWGQADLLAGADAETGVTRADLASLALSCSGSCGAIGQRGDAELSGPQNGAVMLRTWLGGSSPCTTLRWCSAYVPGGAGAITPSEGFCTLGVNANLYGLARTEPGACYLLGRKTVLCAECPADCRACDPATRTCTYCLDGFNLVDGACVAQ